MNITTFRMAVDPENIGVNERRQDAIRPDAVETQIPGFLQSVLPFRSDPVWYYAEFEKPPAQDGCHDRTVETVDLPRRMISEKDVEEALEESRPFKEQFEHLMDEIRSDPGIREKPRWYTDVTKAYRRMERGNRVRQRFELQETQPSMPIKVHAMRLGDIAFATNPFELYLDYAVRMRELSPAVQTFLIQKARCNGTYLPSERSVSPQGYGSVPASTDIGPEGGDKLVESTVATINTMFEEDV